MTFGTYIINAVNGLELNLLNGYLLNGKMLKGIFSGNSLENGLINATLGEVFLPVLMI